MPMQRLQTAAKSSEYRVSLYSGVMEVIEPINLHPSTQLNQNGKATPEEE